MENKKDIQTEKRFKRKYDEFKQSAAQKKCKRKKERKIERKKQTKQSAAQKK